MLKARDLDVLLVEADALADKVVVYVPFPRRHDQHVCQLHVTDNIQPDV